MENKKLRTPAEIKIERESVSSVEQRVSNEREKGQKKFHEIREAESINNSTKFFGNNSVFNDEYSQVLELSSALDFRLGTREGTSIK
jgi:hypothetical protein